MCHDGYPLLVEAYNTYMHQQTVSRNVLAPGQYQAFGETAISQVYLYEHTSSKLNY